MVAAEGYFAFLFNFQMYKKFTIFKMFTLFRMFKTAEGPLTDA